LGQQWTAFFGWHARQLLGAFVMGSIIAETTSVEKVEHVIKPVKDLFGAVFFIL
jgi:Kef-type K+ transport system membrane component KefB